MTPRALIQHRLPERIRLRIPGMRGNAGYFSALSDWLAGLEGVRRVQADSRTGGVLILYAPSAFGGIRDCAREEGWFHVEDLREESLSGVAALEQRLRGFDERLSRISGGGIDLRSLLFLTLVGLAGHQIVRGQIMAPATTLLWYARGLLEEAPLRER